MDTIREEANVISRQGKKLNSFYIDDMQSVEQRINLWREMLPRVEIFYAMKSGPNCIKTAVNKNVGVDVASLGEIKQALALGVDTHNLI